MSDRPTPAQWVGISELRRHLAVTAGAGAGKTWVLTERYLSMLYGYSLALPPSNVTEMSSSQAQFTPVEPAMPSEIVAITFTKEAAAEMRRRIRRRLTDLMRTEVDPVRIAELERWILDIESAAITTIHGYCSQLVRRFPLQADIDPMASIMEPHESEALLREIVSQVLDDGLTAEDEVIEGLVAYFGTRKLVIEALATYNAMREQTSSFEEVAAQSVRAMVERREETPLATEQFVRVVDEALSVGLSADGVSRGARDKAVWMSEAWDGGWRDLLRTCGEDGPERGVFDEELAAVLKQLTSWGPSGNVMKPYVEQIQLAAENLQRTMYYSEDAQVVGWLGTLLSRVHNRYVTEKARLAALDFSDLQMKAAALLEDDGVCESIARRIRYLLVDEFQDTNHMQATLIQRLLASNPRLRVFMVGDAKQSIYRFRGADIDVFASVRKQLLGENGRAVVLEHNFRTQQPIVTFINDVFGQIMTSITAAESQTSAYEAMKATRDASGPGPFVDVVRLLPSKSGARTRIAEARTIANKIRSFVEGPPCVEETGTRSLRRPTYGDMALLLAAMTHVPLYEQALEEAGIPYYVLGSRAFYRRQEVIDLWQVLRAIVDPDDEIAHIAFLRSPLGGVSDEAIFWLGKMHALTCWDEKQLHAYQISVEDGERLQTAEQRLRRWRAESTWRSPGQLLERILEDTGYEQTLLLQVGGEQRVGNVRKLLQLAEESSSIRTPSAVGFLQYLEEMVEDSVDEEDAQLQSLSSGAVKVMTVHKSKGLEFPIVFVPHMERPKASRTESLLYVPGKGLTTRRKDSGINVGWTADLLEHETERSREEMARLFYVAATRARDRLVLTGGKSDHRGKTDLWAASNWMDWLIGAKEAGAISGIVDDDEADGTVRMVTVDAEGVLAVGDRTSERAETVSQDHSPKDESGTPPTEEQLSLFETQVLAHEPASEPNRRWDRFKGWDPVDRLFAGEIHDVAHPNRDEIESRLSETFPLLPASVRSGNSAVASLPVGTVPLSITSLLTLISCERRFFYDHVLRLPAVGGAVEAALLFDEEAAESAEHKEPRRNGSNRSDIPATLRGVIVHRAFEYLDSVGRDSKVAVDKALLSLGVGIEETAEWYGNLVSHVEVYARSSLADRVGRAAKVLREFAFQAKIGDIVLSGMMDCLCLTEDGGAIIVDYKTNRLSVEQLPQVAAHYAPQLRLYAKVVEDILHLKVEETVLYFTSLGLEVPISHGPEAYAEVEAELLSHAQALTGNRESANYRKTDQLQTCASCSHRLLCKR